MASFSSSSSTHGHGAGSPCGACKFLRRKCTVDCIFAPYFHSEQEPTRFASIHKVFGASNASKLLQHVPPADRFDAVSTIAYEAQARMQDPVYGCVSHIFALQHQVVYLQAQLMQVRAQLAQKLSETQNTATPQSPGNNDNNNDDNNNDNITLGMPSSYPTCILSLMNSASPQSSSDLADKKDNISINNMQGIRIKEDRRMQCLNKGMALSDTELGDIQELAFRLMKD